MLKILAFVGLAALSQAAFPKEDLVQNLDQMPDLSFGFYSGYVPINGTQKSLHYVAALSQGDWTVDPVIIWFNGGPGCSSMIGLLQEHGPYVMEDGALNFTKNTYSWNNEASMIYIESPAGVGFSRCLDPSECIWNDGNTADDHLVAVLNLFTMKFYDLQKNDLYIAGESYGGIYVPQLVLRMDSYITTNTGKSGVYIPQLKGFMVGNGVTHYKYDGEPAWHDFAYWSGLIDDKLHNNLTSCNYTYFDFTETTLPQNCKDYLDVLNNLTVNINPYDVFGKCYTTTSQLFMYPTKTAGLMKVGNEIKAYKKYFTASEYTPFSRRLSEQQHLLGDSLPCTYGVPIVDYLGRADVRTAFNIPTDVQAFSFCVDGFKKIYTKWENGTYEIYDQMKSKYKILKYSGDTDGVIPTLGTTQWINDFNWEIKDAWKPWYYDGQVGGYVETRANGQFTFATVHGAGHMAAQWRRPQTYHAIFNFVRGDPI